MNSLIVIPARGGSKGIPRKNVKLLNGKPLIYYSIDVARQFIDDKHICVSTDDEEIMKVVNDYGLNIPFRRPDSLATDNIGTYEVLLHAIDFYEKRDERIDIIILLQPTSPFRLIEHIQQAVALYSNNIDMVVSVQEASSNPYYNCFEKNEQGYLVVSKGDGSIGRRQDAPTAFEYNGSIYVINVNSLKSSPISGFKRVIGYRMSREYSIDLDTLFDWQMAEVMLMNKLVEL